MTLLAKDRTNDSIQCLRPESTSTIAVSGTAASTSAVFRRVCRIMCDVDCFYTINGTATVNDVPLPAGTIEFIHTFKDDTISVITSSASGTFYVTEMV